MDPTQATQMPTPELGQPQPPVGGQAPASLSGQPAVTAPSQNAAPEVQNYLQENEQRWQQEKQTMQAEIDRAKQYENLVYKMAKDPNAAQALVSVLDPNGQHFQQQQPLQQQQQAHQNQPYNQMQQEDGVDPDVREFVNRSLGSVVDNLKRDIVSTMDPYVQDLRQMQVTQEVANVAQRYPDIKDPEISAAVKREMAETPGLSLLKAYKLVTVENALARAQQKGVNEGIQRARMGVVEEPSMAQNQGPVPDETQTEVRNLMKAGKTSDAVRLAMQQSAVNQGMFNQ